MYAESLRAFLKPVLKYLDDDSVSEIMINGPEDIWIETKGKLIKTDAVFTEEALLGCARNIGQFVGRRLTDEAPRLDARLPDGSRVHVVIPPIARKGTTVSIRKFFKDKLTIDKLVEFGSMTAPMARFIEGCVRIKENIIVAGGTGSGKTTLLNIVSSLIPGDERILTIEDSAELQLNQEHLVPFESRPADKFGKGEVNMGHLLHSALRLRPDRIVVGEVRGGEAFDLMQAMNTGHGGSMATTHANTPTDTLRRLESLCLMSGIDLPMVAVRAQVASGINVVITCERFQDGSRKTTSVAEVLPLNDKGDYRTQDIFVWTTTHKDAEGKLHGYHAPTGVIPNFIGRLRSYGFDDMDDAFFDPDTYGVPPPPVFNADAVQTHWVKKLKHREKGEADSDELAQKWAADRLATGKAAEQQAREAAAKKGSPKPTEPPKSPEPALRAALPEHRPEPAPRPPSEPTSTSPLDDLLDEEDLKFPPVSAAQPPAARPPPRAPSTATRVSGTIEIADDLLEESVDADDALPEPEATRAPSAPPFRRPGASLPRPTAGIRAPGARRPAPSTGFGSSSRTTTPDPEGEDGSLSDRPAPRDPRRR